MTRQEYYGGVIGMKIEPDTSRDGFIDDGLIAWPERIEQAERHWPRGRLDDFEQLDRRGRKWRDRATGTLYRRVDGCGPVIAPTIEAVDCWLVQDGKFVFLIRDYRPEATTVLHGEYYAAQVIDGQIVKEKR